GVSKEDAQLDLWLKDIAPSPPLRQEFGHMPGILRSTTPGCYWSSYGSTRSADAVRVVP
ncbi:MAG TPA: hypothetical protein DEP82_07600, partial [Arthrobacter bacterium]|nr:hypothetical protein [Arthrobacter sp.]